jgi:virulence-associated protein VapD
MFVIALDMTIADVQEHQWSVFAANDEDPANLFRAIDALRALEWFGPSVKNIRAFRMEQGSDFTAIVKGS